MSDTKLKLRIDKNIKKLDAMTEKIKSVTWPKSEKLLSKYMQLAIETKILIDEYGLKNELNRTK